MKSTDEKLTSSAKACSIMILYKTFMLISSYLRSFFILCSHSVTTCFCLKLECIFSLCLCLCEWQGACRLDNNADNCQRTMCVGLWLHQKDAPAIFLQGIVVPCLILLFDNRSSLLILSQRLESKLISHSTT